MWASLSSLSPNSKAKITSMSEKVLAVPRLAIESLLQQGFFEDNGADLMGRLGELAVFLDRRAAEEDPSHKQIIPYILIVHQERVLLYKRTKKQGESRLHEKFSLGFGGHINDIDGNKDTDTNLILAAMIRELNEELFLPSICLLRVAGFINDDTNPVGRVHLGVAFIVETANDRFAINEPEMIEAKWCDAQAIEAIFPLLESWSQLLWSQYAKIRIGAPTAPAARFAKAI
jgi:predicted NUDIX family phosphoesterase